MTTVPLAARKSPHDRKFKLSLVFLGALTLLTGCLTLPSAALGAGGTVSTPPVGYTFCANENQKCRFSGQKSVAYGANGKFYYLTLTGGTACTNAVFGDPIFGTFKACYISAIKPSTFGFQLSTAGNQSVNAGSSVTNTITANLVSGNSQQISFSSAGFPS